MIVSGGENIYCTEVEEVLYLHAMVLEAAVFGVPDATWGEAVHAVVVLRGEATAEEMIEHCKQHIGGDKEHQSVQFRDQAVPKAGPGEGLKRGRRAPHP